MDVTLVHDDATLYGLKDEWNALQTASDSDSFFASWEWLRTWREMFNTGELWLLLARDNKRLIGVAPLVLTRYRAARGLGWKQLQFLSAEAPVDHWDFVIERGREQAVIEAFLQVINRHRDRWDVLQLANLLPTSPNLDPLRRATIPWEETDGHITPYIPLPADFDEFFSQLSRNKRQQQRRYRRKLEKAVTDWSFDCVDGDDIAPTMQEFIRFHQAKWETLGKPGAFDSPQKQEFHHILAQRLAENAWLRLFRLQVDGHTAGILYMFAYRGRMSYFNSGLNADYDHLNTGHILHELAIRHAIEAGFREYDFMWGEERYKYSWGALPRVDRVLTWYATPRARLVRGAISWARAVKRRLQTLTSSREVSPSS